MAPRQRLPNTAANPTATSPSPPSTPNPNPAKVEWYRPILNLFLARTIRFLGIFGFWLHNKRYSPPGIPVTRTVKVKVRDGHEVLLNIYEPPKSNAVATRPCVINFHGGGFSIGSSTDDSRWALWCTSPSGTNSKTELNGLGAIFISVEYRLAPEYPFPTPVNDCIDTTLYIIQHFEELGLGVDLDKVFLSGFSAGGSLAVTTALALSHSSTSHMMDKKTSTPEPTTDPKQEPNHPITGIIPFYPVLDFHTPRSTKRDNIPNATPLPGWLTRMFDTSYLPPLVDRRNSMISPGLASDEELVGFPNIHLCLCGADVLSYEGRVFGERLQSLAQAEVIIREVEGARHGWDKPPLALQGSVGVEYDAAIESMKRWCGE